MNPVSWMVSGRSISDSRLSHRSHEAKRVLYIATSRQPRMGWRFSRLKPLSTSPNHLIHKGELQNGWNMWFSIIVQHVHPFTNPEANRIRVEPLPDLLDPWPDRAEDFFQVLVTIGSDFDPQNGWVVLWESVCTNLKRAGQVSKQTNPCDMVTTLTS